MDENKLNQLYAPFEVKARPGQGGQTFKYVPSDDIIDRMNKVFAGKWDTEVISSEIVEDQVLIHVRVSVEDDNKKYYHDGYASQQIARFSQGPRQGQSIDIGNVYKSAMSKAIKTAVAKWGVGLYLSEKQESTGTGGGFGSNPVNGFPYSEPAPSAPQPPSSTPVQNSPQSSNPFETSGAGVPAPDVTTNSSNPFGSPATTTPAPTSQPTQSAGPFESAPSNAGSPAQPPMPPPPTSFETNTGGGQASSERLTDVQKTAIESSMEAHNIDFGRLIAEALPDVQNPPSTIEEVTYEQAIRLIQFNNNYSRQNR